MPSHSKLTCKKIFRGLLRVIPFRCPSVASRNPFAPFLDPVHVPHVRSFWLSWTPYEDPRGSCGNILRNSLLIPYFTVDRPSRILRSDFTYPVRRTGISPFLALRSWPFFEQEHWACGKTTGQATHQHISHLHDQVPQVLVIAQLTLSPPAFYLYRRLGAAVFLSEHFHWKLLLAWFSYVAACFLRLPHLPPFGCCSGSGTAFFLYLTIFLICSASQIGCFSFVTFLVTVVRFPLFRSPVSPHGVTQNNDRSGFFPSPPRLTAILARFEQYLFVSLFQMFLKSAEAPVISVSEAALILPGDGHTNTLHVFLRLRVSESQVSMERVI